MTARTVKSHVHGVADPRCAHEDCQTAWTRYQKRWRYDVAHGQHRTVPTERVRNHLASLEGAGWSVRAIGEAAGVPASVVSRLRLKRQATVTRTVEAALLRLDPLDPPERKAPRGFIPKWGTVRRLQALMALGWSPALLAAHVGESDAHWVYNRLHQSGLWVTRDVRDRVAAMYEGLAMRLPPETTQRERVAASRARTAARKQGWLPPLAWDDESLDDPNGRPVDPLGDDEDDDYDHAVVERFIEEGRRPGGRQLTHLESAEVVRRLRARGVSTTEMEKRYGLKPERFKEGESA